MFSNSTKDIGIGFYTTDNTPDTWWFHKISMSVMRCKGHKYAHVEAIDDQERFYGIYSGQQIHTMERRKFFDRGGKYEYYTLTVTQDQHKKFYNFFSKKKKNSRFNYSVYLIFTRCDMGSNRFFCSQLIAEALLSAGIFSRHKWPRSYKITPDILFSLLYNSDRLLMGSKRVKILRKIKENEEEREKEHVIDMYN